MSEKTERVKIRLNRLIILSLKEFKKLKFGDTELPIQDSYVVAEAYKTILPKLDKICWDKINKVTIPNVTDNKELSSKPLPTTLTLEIDVLKGLREIQKGMVEKTKGRIFFSYVIKVVLYSAILDKLGELEKYTID